MPFALTAVPPAPPVPIVTVTGEVIWPAGIVSAATAPDPPDPPPHAVVPEGSTAPDPPPPPALMTVTATCCAEGGIVQVPDALKYWAFGDPPMTFQVPGVPAVVQTQMLPVRSTTKSPAANVPADGAPEVVAPAYRDGAVAPGRPVAVYSGATTYPFGPTETDESNQAGEFVTAAPWRLVP